MITISDYANKRWTYIGRTLSNNLTNMMEYLQIKLKIAQKCLLEAKKNEDRFKYSELIKQIEIWEENVAIAENEAEIIANLGRFLLIYDAEKAKLLFHVKHVLSENKWLKSEMYDLQGILYRLEHECLIAEAETKYFQCYYNMRNYLSVRKKSQKVEKEPEFQDDDSDPEESIPNNMQAIFHVVMKFIFEGHHTAAISWCQKSIGDYQKRNGEISSEVGAIHSLLGRVYKDFGYLMIAQECFEKSLSIRQKVHGRNSDNVGITLSLLGSIFGKRELYQDAIRITKEALAIRENILPKTHVDISRLYLKLAEYSLKLELWNDSIEYYKIALGNLDKVFDMTELCMIKSYTNLAHAYVETNNLSKAAMCLENVNASYMKKNFPGSSNTTNPLALIQDCITRNVSDFHAETLMQRFGSVSEVSDENVVNTMILYYQKRNEMRIVDILKSWIDISNKNINQSELNNIKPPKKINTAPQESQRHESVTSHGSSFRQSLRSLFKGKK